MLIHFSLIVVTAQQQPQEQNNKTVIGLGPSKCQETTTADHTSPKLHDRLRIEPYLENKSCLYV